LLQACYFADTD
jgi:hypothetical protein